MGQWSIKNLDILSSTFTNSFDLIATYFLGELTCPLTGKTTSKPTWSGTQRTENFTRVSTTEPKNSPCRNFWLKSSTKGETWSSADTRWVAPLLPSSPSLPCRRWGGGRGSVTRGPSGASPSGLRWLATSTWSRFFVSLFAAATPLIWNENLLTKF